MRKTLISDIEHRDCISNVEARLVLFLTRFISVQLQIEEISRKLRTGELGIAPVEERFGHIEHTTHKILYGKPLNKRLNSVIKSPNHMDTPICFE